MKIAITAQDKTLTSEVDPRFGRCKYFIFVDSETMDFSCLENPFINATGGAGIQSAQFVLNQNPDVIITGKLGPKADSALQGANAKCITGANGTIEEVVKKYING